MGPEMRPRYRSTAACEQVHRPLGSPYQPQGQGFIAQTSMNSLGKVCEPCTREMVTCPVLERLAHGLDGVAPEFRQLVEEQHALVRERDLARAAHRSRRRRAQPPRRYGAALRKGRDVDERMLRGQKAHDGIDLRDLQLLLPRHIRQDGRQALGEHALAGAGRAHQKDIMPACGRDFKCPLGIFLPFDVLEVEKRMRLRLRLPDGRGLDRRFAGQMAHELRHVLHAVDGQAARRASPRARWPRGRRSPV